MTERPTPTNVPVVIDDPWEQSVIRHIRTFRRQGAFGTIRVQVERGEVIRVLVERSIKSPFDDPPEHPDG